MIQQDSKTSYHYLPLVREGERFVEFSGVDLFDDEALRKELFDYVEAHYTTVDGEVEISGQLYFSKVYIPISGNDLCYVLSDKNRVPIGAKFTSIKADEIETYLDNSLQDVCLTESIFPELEIDLRSKFVRPTFKQLRPGVLEDKKTVSWDSFTKHGYVVLLGDPGSGKTTCLRRAALELADVYKSTSTQSSIPIYLQLREFADCPLNVEALRGKLVSQDAGRLSRDFSAISRSGRFLLIFDGLDEVSHSQRERIVDSIRQICNEFPRNRVLVSARKQAYHWQLPNFTHFELQPFTVPQVKEWSYLNIRKKDAWRVFITYLKESEKILEVVSNPLMLSLTVAMFLRQFLTPHNESNLIKHYIKALVEDWDLVRNIKRYNERWAAPHRIYPILCNLSFALNMNDKNEFSEEEFLEWRKDAPGKVSSRKMLLVLAETTGLVDELGSGKWVFKNETFKEYLAAQYLVGSTLDAKRFFDGQLSKDSWRDIWKLSCAITYDANHLLEIALRSADIDSLSKSLLLAQALPQDLEVSNKMLAIVCDALVGVIETYTESFIQVTGEVPPFRPHNENPLWLMRLKTKNPTKVIDSSQALQVRRLLRSIYKSRSGPAREFLITRLRNSNSTIVRGMADCFEVEGEYTDGVIETDKEKDLFIAVYPQSPQIKLEG